LAAAVGAVAFPLALVVGLSLLTWSLVSIFTGAPLWNSLVDIFADLRTSHIEGNVPEPEDFDRFLKRDLESYFSESAGKPVCVTCEVLSDEPYQVGLSYPKYNIWVRGFEGDALVFEGLAWVGAAEKSYFYVVDYWSADELREVADDLDQALPKDVAEKIVEKIN
jgi:hypothetical protein